MFETLIDGVSETVGSTKEAFGEEEEEEEKNPFGQLSGDPWSWDGCVETADGRAKHATLVS